MEDTSRLRAEKRSTTAAALAVGFVCIVVGLPVWWKTTTVYRADLPYKAIEIQYKYRGLFTPLRVEVIIGKELTDQEAKRFKDKLRQALDGKVILQEKFAVQYTALSRCATKEELGYLSTAKSVTKLDKMFSRSSMFREDESTYVYVLMFSDTAFKPARPVVGKGVAAYIPVSGDLESAITDVVRIAKSVHMNINATQRAYNAATNATYSKSDANSKRIVRSHPGYQLTFTLLNPQPNIVAAHWDFPAALQAYLKPFLSKLEKYVHLEVKSQYLHSAGVGVRPKKSDQYGGSVLQYEDLTHIINPVEAFLGSHVSNYPDLNFVVYVPPKDHSPLLVLDKAGEPAQSNSFLIPQWGGFMVYNTEVPDNASLPHPVELDMKPMLEVFASQIKLLLGITTHDFPDDVDYEPPGPELITDWELEGWLRKKTLENFASSTSTLYSLTNLVGKINNMIIYDDVAIEVNKSSYNAAKAFHFVRQGDIKTAYFASVEGLVSSERAFFDPSLLELLYFPEDQKFAIYIPLFLPIGIPIIMSVMQAIKYIRKKPDKEKSS